MHLSLVRLISVQKYYCDSICFAYVMYFGIFEIYLGHAVAQLVEARHFKPEGRDIGNVH